ncbi:MAG: RNA polymerase sigma factor (sigma-70 family) [Bacteroidia bacterium]|jgi:RNA polymerase sigma factor (sigma-70 family)
MGKERNLTSEQDIISACIDNDSRAQKILFENYAPKMLGVCARYCSNMEDAKDALHEGFIKVFQRIEKFKGTSTLETWMTRLMINTAIDQFKKSTKYLHFEEAEKVHEYSDDDSSYILNLEDDEEEVRLSDLYKIIAQLPDGYKMVFNLYVIEGYSHNNIAKELKISAGTSKSQLARARKMLKKLVKEQLNIG